MEKLYKLLSFFLVLTLPVRVMAAQLPKEFVYLSEIDSSILQEIKYAGTDNFLGRPIKGYSAPKCILTLAAAKALATVQAELKVQGLGLKVFDGYRPQMAVDEFISWSQDPTDQKMKAQFYPRIDKSEVFKLGYVAARSGHSRGSTVDVTLVSLVGHNAPAELDMGTHFDFMDELSHPLNPNIVGIARTNRWLLRDVMQKHGFDPIDTEWWHFTLRDEPFKDQYFNFPVE